MNPARAVVGGRQLLLADEPSGALDSTNAEAVMRLILAACHRGMAAVVVTLDAQLASWADRVIFLRDGRVVDQTPLAHPADCAGGQTDGPFKLSTSEQAFGCSSPGHLGSARHPRTHQGRGCCSARCPKQHPPLIPRRYLLTSRIPSEYTLRYERTYGPPRAPRS